MHRPVIELRSVSKAYWKKPPKKSGGPRKKARHVILDSCTAEFPHGRSVAVLGAQGSGRTTLLRLISGSDYPDRGRVVRHGRMAPLGGFPGLKSTMSGRQNCRFVARLYGIEVPRLEAFIADFTELGEEFNSPLGNYSKQMKSRVALGLFMAPDFDCYLFDGGIWFGDPGVRERTRALFDLKRQSASVILASNSPSQIRTYCNMGAVLHEGRLHVFDDLEDAIQAFQSIGGTLIEGDVEPPQERQVVVREAEDDSELF